MHSRRRPPIVLLWVLFGILLLAPSAYAQCIDNDRDGYGDPASPLCLFDGLDCDDTRFEVNPGALEICDGLDNDCNTEVDEDVDGDGSNACDDCNNLDPEVRPGATEQCNGYDDDCDEAIDEGFTPGQPPCPAPLPLGEILGEQQGESFGRVVAGIGDVDGDGYDELLVGSPSHDGAAGSASGKVTMYKTVGFPINTPDPDKVLLTLEGVEAFGGFGSAIAGGGDFDEDGFADFLVSAPGFDLGRGRVYVISGDSGIVIRTHDGESLGDNFGGALTIVGDVGADGVPEYAISAPGAEEACGDAVGYTICNPRGKVYVFSGALGTTLFTKTGGTTQENGGECLGASLDAMRGDVNGNGTPDLIAGAPCDSGGVDLDMMLFDEFARGAIKIFDGLTGAQLKKVVGAKGYFFYAEFGDAFGTAVAGLGDVNGDERADFAASAPFHVGAGLDKDGRVYVYSGAGGLLYQKTGEDGDNVDFGEVLAYLGDLDQDGAGDLAIGIPQADGEGGETLAGRMIILSGKTGNKLYERHGAAPFEFLGSTIGVHHDINGFGASDLVLGFSTENNSTGRIELVAPVVRCGNCAPLSGRPAGGLDLLLNVAPYLAPFGFVALRRWTRRARSR